MESWQNLQFQPYTLGVMTKFEYIKQNKAMVNFPNLPYRPRPMLGNPRQTWILDATSC